MSDYKLKIIELIKSDITGYKIHKTNWRSAICNFTIKARKARSR